MQNQKIITLAVSLIIIISITSNIQAQDGTQRRDRIIEKGNDFNAPVEITLIKSKIGRIEINKKFSADEDWFKGLVISLQNKSDKPITHLSASIRFPRPEEKPEKREKEKKLDFVVPLEYGENPIPSESGQILNNTATPILPGGSVELQLSDNEYNSVRNALKESGFPLNINKIKVYVSLIGFSDGSIWIGGKFYRLDKVNPGKLIPIEKKTSNFSYLSNVNFVRSFLSKINFFLSSVNIRHYDVGVCGDQITQTYRRECLGNCYAIDISVGGDINGDLGTQNVERFCRSNDIGGSCSAKKVVAKQRSCPAEYTLSATPTSTNPGGIVTVTWTASRNRTNYDYIQLNEQLESSFYNHGKQYISGGTSGTLTFAMPQTPGTYEFRYITSEGEWVKTSDPITVAATPTPTPTPTPPPDGGGCMGMLANPMPRTESALTSTATAHKSSLRGHQLIPKMLGLRLTATIMV